MLRLTQVTIDKYKSFLSPQSTSIEDSVTAFVGKNESGKTAFLEALAKFNYFQDDQNYKFDEILDYPRTELKKFQRNKEQCEVLKCTFVIGDELLNIIKEDVGEIKINPEFACGVKYGGGLVWYNVTVNEELFIKNHLKGYELSKEIVNELSNQKTIVSLLTYSSSMDYAKYPNIDIESNTREISNLNAHLTKIKNNSYDWPNLLQGYIAKTYLEPNFPKFWYFDEYYALPSRININHLKANHTNGEFDTEALNTSKALFELANINIDQLIQSSNFERFKTELEATSNEITDQIFEYWKTNENLEIEFAIDVKTIPGNPQQTEKILDIRVKNKKHRVTLPLKNRSKGFKWFFSFLVWFSKIQADKNSNYILLLDEPGLNLHASAQSDLLRFIEKLGENYQVIYTTHSPFMIDSLKLHRVRTIFDSEKGSKISEAIQEKDPDTLFPLQAALGYDIAQNLFISKNNLLVEGPADLLYLSIISNILESKGRIGLDPKITIVPIGGLDKVATFISLLRGSKLSIVCLLDSFNDAKGKQRIDDLIRQKIIKDRNINYFNEFISIANNKADIEDLFKKEEYLSFFNSAFSKYADISIADISGSIPNIIIQINKYLGIDKFNHYGPAYEFAKRKDIEICLSEDTFNVFEAMFKKINSLF